MSILDRSALEQSPLADLHAIASELALDGYRRLRKPQLIDAILERQSGDASGLAVEADAAEVEADAAEVDADAAEVEADAAEVEADAVEVEADAVEVEADAAEVEVPAAEVEAPPAEVEAPAAEVEAPAAPRRRTRRSSKAKADAEAEPPREEPPPEDAAPARRRRRKAADEEPAVEAAPEPVTEDAPAAEPQAEGVVEVLGNGSAFMRVNPPDPSDEDIYISAAQVKRCELVSGDRIAGPRRAPRRSERFASLVRVDMINGRPASEVADSARFDELPAGFAVERFRLGSEDPTLKAIEFLTPFGRGSRVTIAGSAQAGKSHALRMLADALLPVADVQVLVTLVGVRPEELPEWGVDGAAPAAAVSIAGSPDAQAQAVERVLDQARRLVSRGNHVVVLIDTLASLPPTAARKAMASARRIVDGGSLTLIATAAAPVGGETTVITLDTALTAAGRWPAVDLAASWTMRPELLVGDDGAEMIARARAEALER